MLIPADTKSHHMHGSQTDTDVGKYFTLVIFDLSVTCNTLNSIYAL
jgi:hypothetical protein